MPSSTLLSSRSIPLGGGPPKSFPSAVNCPLWQGHTKLPFSSCQEIEHPRCGQMDENARSWPFASLQMKRAFSETILRQPSRCSILTSLLTGSETLAHSSTLPTSVHAKGIVPLISG